MSREEAAAKAMVDLSVKSQTSDAGELAQAALAAADAHDAAHGIHRVSLDDATVERAAEAALEHQPWLDQTACGDGTCLGCDIKAENDEQFARHVARAVLAAAVEAGQ